MSPKGPAQTRSRLVEGRPRVWIALSCRETNRTRLRELTEAVGECRMSKNASPQTGDIYLGFNGRDAYVEIPSIADYSVSTTGEFTVSVWLRPDTLNFPFVERKKDYIHWLGKGE